MSDQSQGPGWWQASDQKWYPPESHPDYRPLPPPPPPPQIGQPAPGGAPAGQPLVVKGVNGTVVFDGSTVEIRRTGLMAKATVGGGDKRIPLRSITAIQLKPAGLSRGFIQFTIPGGVERRSRPGFGKQATDAAKDENSVLFNTSQQPAFERLRAEIEARIV